MNKVLTNTLADMIQKRSSEKDPDYHKRRIFRERLKETVVKHANEEYTKPANLYSDDPYKEYLRRKDVLDKTGSEMSVRDIVLGAQAFKHLLNKKSDNKG